MKINYFAAPELMALAQHSSELGWYSDADWECFLRTGAVFGHKLKSGEVVSSAYFSNFENRIGWLGAVIVNPRFQGKKLGRDLIQKAISISPDDNDFVLALISTERGKKMYQQAGFVEIGNTHKFVGEWAANEEVNLPPNESGRVRNFQATDLNRICALDAQAVGYKRNKLLVERLRCAVQTLIIEDDLGEAAGCLIVSQDGQRHSLGPLIADSLRQAQALIQSATSRGGSFRIDVPHWQHELINFLALKGFALERICPMLTYKGRPLPVVSNNYFALMAQALG